MYGLKLYIPLDELNAYIHENIDGAYRDHTFVPVKSEFNEGDQTLQINLMSVNPIDSDGRRYKLNLNGLLTGKTEPEQNNDRCKDCTRYPWDMPQCKECNAENKFKNFRKW